jgi:hypothetical protein
MRIARRLSFLYHSLRLAPSSRAELSAPTVIRTLLKGPFTSPPADFWGSAIDGVSGEPEALFRNEIGCAVANALVWDAGAIEPGRAARWSERVVIEPVTRAGR